MKLFGGRRPPKNGTAKKPFSIKYLMLILLSLLFCIELFYFLLTYSPIPLFRSMRDIYIETAMSTMRYQWLAKSFFPEDIVNEVMSRVSKAQEEQIGINSQWNAPKQGEQLHQIQFTGTYAEEKSEFYSLFPDLDEVTFDAYMEDHTELDWEQWERFYIDRSGLEDSGTDIRTKQGDQVLAVDSENRILLVRVTGAGYRGVLAIAGDPARLSVETSSMLGSCGQYAGQIAQAHDGVLAMTACGFIDENEAGEQGRGNGGILCGLSVSHGKTEGRPLGYSFKRAELHRDDRLYIVDSDSPVSRDCTDAAEFTPALIVDGTVLVDESCGWNAINPRACIGQDGDGRILMLGIEGRSIASLGTGVVECAAILARYHCMQALNLDGGTSAIMWYRGKYVMHCSNAACPEGRTLPNAFVYRKKP